MEKRIHIRVEHVRKSRCREAFVERIRENDRLKNEASKAGKKISTKRRPVEPRPAHVVKGEIKYQNPQVYKEVFWAIIYLPVIVLKSNPWIISYLNFNQQKNFNLFMILSPLW